jgi:molecular chaperone DnaK (HSP70)
MTAPPPKLLRVFLGFDVGSANSSAAYSIETTSGTRKVHICKDSILPRIRVVGFGNLDTQAATVISYGRVSEDINNERFLFGHEVLDALDRGTITPDKVIRWLKVALFDPSQSGLNMKHRIEQQISNLPDKARFIVKPNGITREINCQDLFSLFLGYLWRSTLRHMKTREKCFIPWEDLPNQDQYREVDTANVQFDIAVAVPALATPQQCDRISEAAKMAGLGAPFILSEPSAAPYYLLQSDFEDGDSPASQVALVVDIGAGTAVLSNLIQSPD